jgi:hypothetical protein
MLELCWDRHRAGSEAHVILTPPLVRSHDVPAKYLVDVRAKTETNVETGYVRSVCRREAHVRPVHADDAWEYLGDDGWHVFDSNVQGRISMAFDAYSVDRSGGVIEVSVPGQRDVYTLDFVRGIQRSPTSDKDRKIRRN